MNTDQLIQNTIEDPIIDCHIIDCHIIDLQKIELDQIFKEWRYSSKKLREFLNKRKYSKEILNNKEYSKKGDINADIFLPYLKNRFWEGADAISRLRLAVKAEVVIIFSNTELSELEQKNIYLIECLRLWTRINSRTTSLTKDQFIRLLNKCYNEVIDDWNEAVNMLQIKQDNFRPHRVKTLYHYKKEDFDNIYPTMTLREAYDDWMKYKFPHLLEYYKQKKKNEFDQWVLSSKPSEKYKDIKYNKLQTELEALRIKEPSKLAFRKLLDRFDIEYKQKKH